MSNVKLNSRKNISLENNDFSDPKWKYQDIIESINIIYLSGPISFFGIFANVINLIVFYKHGLNLTINITFFAIALSDLFCLILQQWQLVILLFQYFDLPVISTDFQDLTAMVPHATFSRVTCSLTVFITAERCLCVVFPLAINKIITFKRTIVIILCIYTLTLMAWVPLYNAIYLEWRFYPERNRSFLGAGFTFLKEDVEKSICFINAFFAVSSLSCVVVFTTVLILKLRKASAWRNSAKFQGNQPESMSNRDKETLTMVALIAIILVICYTPFAILCVLTVIEPGFSVGGKYFQNYQLFWTFAVVFENVNSSVNIFLYLKMCSKYRATFRSLFRL